MTARTITEAAQQLRRLVAAQRAVGAERSVHAMPARILDEACALLGTTSGRYVVRGSDGAVRVMATVGERHEPGRAELTAGIPVRGEIAAQIIVAAPATAPSAGGPPVGESEQALLDAFASAAGNALETAMLHTQTQRSKDWLHASGEIARALLSGSDVDMLMEVVLRALHVADADAASLFLPTEDGRLVVAVAAGVGSDDYDGYVMRPEDSALATAIVLGQSLLISDMDEVMKPGFENVHDYGPVMSAPLVDAGGVRGAVLLVRVKGNAEFTARDLDLATAFADQVALAFEMDDARSDNQWLRVVEDRHRIAQDLHDNVMQRLFAIGVGLQSLPKGALPPEIARRLGRYIADLDETIDEIRGRVFGLRDADEVPAARAPSRFPRVTRRAAPDEIAPDEIV